MAMGNYCCLRLIECPYATAMGTCRDDIYDDFGMCEMDGNEMPSIHMPAEERRLWAEQRIANTKG